MKNPAARSPSSGPRVAAIYCRISQDRDGDAEGVIRQERDCRELAKRLGYEVPDALVFIENDVSASTKSRKPRPLYDAMIEAAKRGEIQAILSYSTSRITRRVREYLDLIDLVEKHGIQIHTLASGDVNLGTADGRGVAITLAAWDAAEAERIGERVKRAKAAAVEDGRYRGGIRPYGFEKDGVTIVPEEAEVIRWCTQQLLEGRSVRALVRELNERGVASSTGKKWASNNFRDMVLRPRNAGLISTGQRSHGNFQIHGKAVWEAIVPEESWRAVFDLLTAPGRRTNNGMNEAAWLGSGIYRCGALLENGDECRAVLRVTQVGGTTSSPGPRRHVYRCSERGHLMITQLKLDEYVLETAAGLVRDPRIIAALTPKGADLAPDREALSVLKQRLLRTERDYDDDLIDARRYAAKRDKIEAEMAAIEQRMSKAIQRGASSPILGAADPGKALLDAPIDIQRAVVATVLKVTALTAVPGAQGKRLTRDLLKARVRLEPAV